MNTAPRKGLFELGYNDKVLLHERQLEGWKKYLDDNPRRLMVKRMNPGLFTVMQNKEVAGRKCQMVGNCFLLDIPDKVAVADATLCYFPENYSGRLIRKSTYDANNKLVKEEINEYSIANKAKELVNIKVIDNYVGPVNHCLSIEAHPYYNPYIYNGRFFITLYPYIAYDIQLTQQTETEYFNSVPISKEKLYTYNQRNQISTCQTSTSRSDYIQETYKYAADSSFYKDHLDYNVLTTIMRYKRTSGSSTAILENKYGNAFTKFTLLSSTESSNISPKDVLFHISMIVNGILSK